MVEAFTLGEMITMSFLIMGTFIWGQSAGMTITVYILVGVLIFWLRVRGRTNYSPIGFGGALRLYGLYFIWLGASFYVASAATFLAQLLWCVAEKDENTIIGAVVGVTIVVHILIPLLFGGLILRTYGIGSRTRSCWNSFFVGLAGAYGLFFVWQGYIFAPSFIFLGAILHLLPFK